MIQLYRLLLPRLTDVFAKINQESGAAERKLTG